MLRAPRRRAGRFNNVCRFCRRCCVGVFCVLRVTLRPHIRARREGEGRPDGSCFSGTVRASARLSSGEPRFRLNHLRPGTHGRTARAATTRRRTGNAPTHRRRRPRRHARCHGPLLPRAPHGRGTSFLRLSTWLAGGGSSAGSVALAAQPAGPRSGSRRPDMPRRCRVGSYRPANCKMGLRHQPPCAVNCRRHAPAQMAGSPCAAAPRTTACRTAAHEGNRRRRALGRRIVVPHHSGVPGPGFRCSGVPVFPCSGEQWDLGPNQAWQFHPSCVIPDRRSMRRPDTAALTDVAGKQCNALPATGGDSVISHRSTRAPIRKAAWARKVACARSQRQQSRSEGRTQPAGPHRPQGAAASLRHGGARQRTRTSQCN